MKKMTLVVALAAILMSCGGGKKQDASVDGNLPVQASTALEQPINDGHNARNSLDYIGTYRGTLPTASGEGMNVTIGLSDDSTYFKSVNYVGKMTIAVVEEGKYTWNEAGTTITLGGGDAPNQYFVAENAIIQLDIEGNKITGDLADKYRLTKDDESGIALEE